MTRKLTYLQIFRTNFYNYVFDPYFIIRVGVSVDGFLAQTRLLFVRSASLSKINWLIRHFNWHEAVGPDGVQNMELHPVRHLVFKFFAQIYNKRRAINYFIMKWKQIKVIILPKSDKRNVCPLNCRAVVLLNILGKLYE